MDVAIVPNSRNPQTLPYDPRQPVVPATPDRPSSPAYSEWATRSVGRRSSTLPYTQQGIKETVRRRSSKATRWLLMVFPPEVLYNESSTAASSSRTGRFASGILLPLQSTYFAQLTAIAREFGLPSTIGVCIYLQIVEGPQSFAPRMSDESWQILWSPYLSPSDDNPSPSPSHGFPIAGRVEFDIDMAKAKWYTGWVNGTLRQLSHKGESSLDSTETDRGKTKSVRDHDGETSESTRAGDAVPAKARGPISVASGSTTQRAPRRLSLLDRRRSELPAISAPSGVPPRLAHYALENGSTSSHLTQEETRVSTKDKRLFSHLSPIPQVDTPPASSLLQKDVNALVHEWRKSSASVPTAVLATSPAQPNTPPAPTERDLAGTSQENTVAEGLEAPTPIDLADYDWSISSHGPRTPYTPADGTPVTAKLARSIHLAERTYGSVILTPSTQTSWGPGISPAVFTPVSNASRYPSPDIAARMIEDSPCTPSTATSWGPSSSCWASSPVSQIVRLPSPDIAARMIEDAPCTPSTATTWGPPLSFPPTPAHYNVNGDFYRLPSPDLGQRSFDESMPRVTVSEEKPSKLGWPFFRPRTEEEIKAARLGWPFFKPKAAYPNFDLYPAAYPNLEIYPPVSPLKSQKSVVIVSLPHPAPSYPSFELYPACYPTLLIYPDVLSTKHIPSGDSLKGMSLPVALPRPAPSYPDFDLYPAGYPTLVIYPDVVSIKGITSGGSLTAKSLPVALPRPAPGYPGFNLYPAGYPSMDIYPDVVSIKRIPSGGSLKVKSTVSEAKPSKLGWPYFRPRTEEEIKAARLGWPFFKPKAAYPNFDLYPAAYPNLEIYPDVSPLKSQKPVVIVSLPRPAPSYPSFELYPACYPTLVIYPDVLSIKRITSGGSLTAKSLPVALSRPAPGYPDFDLYPAGYPNLDIYPAVTSRIASASRPAPKPVNVRLAAPAVVYPEFNIYPATYPTLVIYPSVASSRTTRVSPPKSESKVSVRLPSTTGYPVFDLYPAVYPNLVVYPLQPLAPSTVRSKPVSRCSEVFVSSVGYPTFDLYPAVYPWVTPYPPCSFQLARPIALSPESKPQRWVPRKTHKTLHDEWLAARPKLQIATPLPPPQPQPTAPLPALPEVSPPAAPAVRSRARSGTVVRPLAAPPRGQLPPPPILPSLPPPRAEPSLHQSPASVSRSREELHALIFGQAETTAQDVAQDVVVSPVAESPVTAIAISPPVQRAPSRRSPSLSPPGGIRVGLPSHPGVMVPGNRRSVAERRATFAMQDPSPSLTRSNTTSRMSTSRSLTVLAERDDVPGLPKSPKSPLSRSVSLSRMKTNDDLFKQRQSLLNSPRRPSTADSNPLSVLSEFPSPPVSARSSMVGSPAGPPRPISKLDTSKYPFLR